MTHCRKAETPNHGRVGTCRFDKLRALKIEQMQLWVDQQA